jgi:hypothetical protein
MPWTYESNGNNWMSITNQPTMRVSASLDVWTWTFAKNIPPSAKNFNDNDDLGQKSKNFLHTWYLFDKEKSMKVFLPCLYNYKLYIILL